MAPQTLTTFFFIIAASTFIVGACLVGAELAHCINESTIWLGDEVETTAEYKELFNDSFSGNVIATMADGLYTVRSENGTERTFEREWISKVDDGGEI